MVNFVFNHFRIFVTNCFHTLAEHIFFSREQKLQIYLRLDSRFRYNSRQTPCELGVLEYEPKKIFRVYSGLNEANINEALAKHKDRHEHKIDKIMVHPNWTGTGLTYPDLALIKIADEFKFTSDGE